MEDSHASLSVMCVVKGEDENAGLLFTEIQHHLEFKQQSVVRFGDFLHST